MCKSKSRVKDSKERSRLTSRVRKRQCRNPQCGHEFRTRETTIIG